MNNQQWNGYTPPNRRYSGGSAHAPQSYPGGGAGPSPRPHPPPFPPSVHQPQHPSFLPQQHQNQSQPRPPTSSHPIPQAYSIYRPHFAPRPPLNGHQPPPPTPSPPLPHLSPPLASPSPSSVNFHSNSSVYPPHVQPILSSTSTPTQGLAALPPKPPSLGPPSLVNSNGKRPIEPVVGQAPRPPPLQRRRWDYKLPPQLPPPIHIIWDGEEIVSELPPIPPLDDPLFSQVFTHTSLKGTSKQVFEEPESTGPIGDYERLEHLGDSVLGFITAELIQDLFPRLTVGCSSELRSYMVNNTTALPAFATAYHLHTQLRASQSQRYILMSQKGCRSQLFEAYLAGIFRQVRFLRRVLAPRSPEELLLTPIQRLLQYGYPLLRTWLRDILTPVAYLAHASLKKQKLAPPAPVLGPLASNVGFTALLNQWGYDFRRKVEYVDSSESVVRGPTQKHKLYEFSVRVGKHQHSDRSITGPSLVVQGLGGGTSKVDDGRTAGGSMANTALVDGEEGDRQPLEEKEEEEEEGEVAGLLVEGGAEEEWLVFGPSQASKKASAKNK
ncbi:hypothetical protein BDY24DRAFT_146723 [Mrakia frigida]|uniref:ribonuclease III domain-containing protein n=1 Tax=Mrakia frigida TaxID=29902 RepID=UPI003FCC1FE4